MARSPLIVDHSSPSCGMGWQNDKFTVGAMVTKRKNESMQTTTKCKENTLGLNPSLQDRKKERKTSSEWYRQRCGRG